MDSTVRPLLGYGTHGRLDGGGTFSNVLGPDGDGMERVARVNAYGSLVNSETTKKLIVHLIDCRMVHLGANGWC